MMKPGKDLTGSTFECKRWEDKRLMLTETTRVYSEPVLMRKTLIETVTRGWERAICILLDVRTYLFVFIPHGKVSGLSILMQWVRSLAFN